MVSFFYAKSRTCSFIVNKILRNMERDEQINKELLFMGRTLIRFWGKEIMKNTDECIKVIEETIFELEMENVE